MLSHYCKLRLGSQKCLRECTDGSVSGWSSTFSFLIHDRSKDKVRDIRGKGGVHTHTLSLSQLLVKLKNKRKFRRNNSVAKHIISLDSLGIIDNHSDNNNIQKVSEAHDSHMTRIKSHDLSSFLFLSFSVWFV